MGLASLDKGNQGVHDSVTRAHPDNTYIRFRLDWLHPHQLLACFRSNDVHSKRILFPQQFLPRQECCETNTFDLSLVFGCFENSNLKVHFHDFSPVGSVNFGQSFYFMWAQAVGVTIYSRPDDMGPSSETDKRGLDRILPV